MKKFGLWMLASYVDAGFPTDAANAAVDADTAACVAANDPAAADGADSADADAQEVMSVSQ